MTQNIEIIILMPLILFSFGIVLYIILKKRKRSAKSIYKLIDALEKKYLYAD